MGNKKVPYLCGGTLFFLLVQAKRPRAKARDRENGASDGLKDPAMMAGLLKAITGNDAFAYEESLKKNTSQFRECKIDGSIYIPFNDPATASGYDYDVKNNYDAVLSRMDEFAEGFLNPAKRAWIVRTLLDVIDDDAGIGDDAHFCVRRDGMFLSKAEVLSETRFELQPFLIGIIHYILMNRRDNISGQETLDAWGAKKGKQRERKLRDDFSLGASRTVKVDWHRPDEQEKIEKIAKTDDDRDSDSGRIEAEVMDGYDECTDESGESRPTPLNQTVFINNGSGVQIGINYGFIDLSHRKGDGKD